MTQVADLLAGLNPAQREAVETVDGPLLIVAGPGSGKTRVITHRIAYLVRECGVSPYSILAMTFTNKAAREMKDRLARLTGPHADALTVGTFHSFCARLLRIEGEKIGLSRNFSIFDDSDQIAAIKEALKAAEQDAKGDTPRAVLNAISRAKSILHDSNAMAIHAQDDYFQEVCARVYRHYEEILSRNNAADFDDLLLRTVQLFREFPVVLQRYQDRYGYLMVDEFQDTNVAQYQLARQLSQGHKNICVVGDPDQSIYSWRSADVRNILNFRNDFPHARTITLGQNYRSTGTILSAAQNLIRSNGQRLENELFTENATGNRILLLEADDETQEASFIISEIQRLSREEGFKLGDCAVMYRFNAQSRPFERICTEQQIKYRLVGGTQIYRRREVQDLTAYLRLILNLQDDLSLSRVVKTPSRNIGAQTLLRLGEWSAANGKSVFEAMREVAASSASDLPCPIPLGKRAVNSISDFVILLNGLVEFSSQTTAAELMHKVMAESGLEEHIRTKYDHPEERLESVSEFCDMANDFETSIPGEGLAALLEHSSLVAQVDDYSQGDEFITLITLHQAKGLEFPVVFIAGLEEESLPWLRQGNSDGDGEDSDSELEEERRLCYVGMTRAEKKLYLTRATWRTVRGQTLLRSGSRFLREIPDELKRYVGSSRTLRTKVEPEGGRGRSIRAAALAAAAAAPAPAGPSLRIGDLVRHRAFGEGIVMATDVTASDVEVTVEFAKGVGVKRLLLSFAPLEKVEDGDSAQAGR